jgi:hypothetical protein
LQFFDSHDHQLKLATLQRLWAGALVALLLLSWRLWVPGDLAVRVDFPSVPLARIASPLAAVVDSVSLCALLAGLVAILTGRISWQPFAVIVLCFSALFLTNQHRLQPWAYQGWLYALIFAAVPLPAAQRLLIALTISIYAYSSLGKFDQQFLNTVGPDLIASLMPWLDRSSADTVNQLRTAAIALPIAELALAVLLAIRRTRWLGGYLALAMHLTLVLILGPLGLQHSSAVIVWNVFLAVQAWLLFVHLEQQGDATPLATDDGSVQRDFVAARFTARVVKAIVVAAIMLPMLERAGYWDHWLSWSLYSPHTSRVDIQLHESALDSVPKRAIDFARPSDDQDAWYDLAIDQWSLAELAVPVYPQARFQLGVANSLAQDLESPGSIRIKIRGVADRRTGQRPQTWLLGREQIQSETKKYRFLPHR